MWQFDREAQHECFENRAIGFGGEVDSYGHGRNTVTPTQVMQKWFFVNDEYESL